MAGGATNAVLSVESRSQLDQILLSSYVTVPEICVEKVVTTDKEKNTTLFCQCGPTLVGSNQGVVMLRFSQRFERGWIGRKSLVDNSTISLDEFMSLMCRGVVLQVWGDIREGNKARKFIEVTQAVFKLIAPQPWSAYKILTKGWELSHGDIESVAIALGGVTVERCGAARKLVLQLGHQDIEEEMEPPPQSMAGGGGGGGGGVAQVRKGRLRDVFRGNKDLRSELQCLVDMRREADGSTVKPRQRYRKTSKREWDALRRADTCWSPFDEEVVTNSYLNEKQCSNDEVVLEQIDEDDDDKSVTAHDSEFSVLKNEMKDDWGSIDPLNNIPNRNDKARTDYIEMKKKPQIVWMSAKLKEVVRERREQGLLGEEECAHMVDIGGGRGDLAITVAVTLPNIRVTVFTHIYIYICI
jgi:hypothetical protein